MAFLFVKDLLVRRERSYSPLELSPQDDVEHSAQQAFARPSTSSRDSTSTHDDDAEKTDLSLDGEEANEAAITTNFRAHLISNFTIGFSDGLTVPFAVTAGLSALGRPRVVIFGGLSELVAGTISMGMGGYLGAKGEVDAYSTTLSATRETVSMEPDVATQQVRASLRVARFPPALTPPFLDHLHAHPAEWVEFLMRFHHQLPPSAFPARYALLSGAMTALGYVSGGIVPLLPYLFMPTIDAAFTFSIIVTACVLLAFGAGKTWVVGERNAWRCARGAAEMFILGGTAAGAAVGCVKAFS